MARLPWKPVVVSGGLLVCLAVGVIVGSAALFGAHTSAAGGEAGPATPIPQVDMERVRTVLLLQQARLRAIESVEFSSVASIRLDREFRTSWQERVDAARARIGGGATPLPVEETLEYRMRYAVSGSRFMTEMLYTVHSEGVRDAVCAAAWDGQKFTRLYGSTARVYATGEEFPQEVDFGLNPLLVPYDFLQYIGIVGPYRSLNGLQREDPWLRAAELATECADQTVDGVRGISVLFRNSEGVEARVFFREDEGHFPWQWEGTRPEDGRVGTIFRVREMRTCAEGGMPVRVPVLSERVWPTEDGDATIKTYAIDVATLRVNVPVSGDVISIPDSVHYYHEEPGTGVAHEPPINAARDDGLARRIADRLIEPQWGWARRVLEPDYAELCGEETWVGAGAEMARRCGRVREMIWTSETIQGTTVDTVWHVLCDRQPFEIKFRFSVYGLVAGIWLRDSEEDPWVSLLDFAREAVEG